VSLPFSKAHGYGNDFLYVRQGDVGGIALDELARAMCDRHTGIGADGLIVYAAAGGASSGVSRVSMRLLNADGSRAEVSGNGVRALGALILRDDLRDAAEVTIDTEAGPKQLTRIAREGSRQTFRASMGLPRDLRQTSMVVDGEQLELTIMDMGNPQAVLLGPLPPRDRFERLGRTLEHHAAFPQGTNIEFAWVERPDTVHILIWERGVGPTSSSGTGSCAALVAAAAFGGASRDAAIIAPGGPQRVEWRDESVYLTGWAEVLIDGTWLGQIPRT
jgi:diaminopimelate epimerase